MTLLKSFHLLLALALTVHAAEFVTYEEFGALGDGLTDDLPAICKAHAHANEKNLPVRSNPNATYHLGHQDLTAIIKTDTLWSTSQFIIDDRKNVKNPSQALFEVRSSLAPIPLKINRLRRNQSHLDTRPGTDCLVFIENNQRKIYRRRGLNRNNGSPQKEVLFVEADGMIRSPIDWDYETITKITALPIDPEPLTIQGGIFTTHANCLDQSKVYKYWNRNLQIRRSKTNIIGLTHRVTDETETGQPYRGFLNISRCAFIVLKDCRIDGRKSYRSIGRADKPVSVGSYGYTASEVYDFRMIGCRMDDIHDRSKWGIIGTNFMKNILIEDCELSRMDVHQGTSGTLLVRRSTLGHAGFNAIGRGKLIVEDSTLHGNHFITFRPDYGATWSGPVTIRNSRWIPRSANPIMFGTSNDGTHDFGYPCSMPHTITIDGLVIDDSKLPENHQQTSLFGNPGGRPQPTPPFPYQLTEKIQIKNLTTTSGKPTHLSTHPDLFKKTTITPPNALVR